MTDPTEPEAVRLARDEVADEITTSRQRADRCRRR